MQSYQDIRLNFIPIQFSGTDFNGGILSYENPEQLSDLRKKYRETHVFRRSGDLIECVPVTADAKSLGKPKMFNIKKDFLLVKNLVQHAIFRFMKGKDCEFVSVMPTTRVVLSKENLLSKLVPNNDSIVPLFLYPEYELESRLLIPYKGDIRFGILINFSTKFGFNATVADLISKGVNVSGRYVVAKKSNNDDSLVDIKYHRKLIGKINKIEGHIITLEDFSDKRTVDINSCFLEPRRDNINHCISSLYPTKAESILKNIPKQIFEITGAKKQLERLDKLIQWFKQNESFKCAPGLSFTLINNIYSATYGRDAGSFRMMDKPDCLLRPGGSITASWPVDPHLEQNGPFDTESFPQKNPRIAVIFPPRYKGEIEIFMRQFRDGITTNSEHGLGFKPYSQGFIRKYRLTDCTIELRPLDSDVNTPDVYRKKCLDVLGEEIPYDLAVVVIEENFHNLHGEKNPYFVIKSVMMSHGLPVQEIEIETIQENRSRRYILNNLSVACYAKMGGIPWVLSSTPGLAHELVFGIGSTLKSAGRLSGNERYVGITTVFSGDGNYLLSNVSKEVTYEEYQDSLLNVLKDSIEQIKKRYAWQPGDKVRMIFHQTFKRFKDEEAAAVKNFIASISDYDVEYAFVQISTKHPWKILDLKSEGINHWFERTAYKKGECVPWRGCYVPLGPRASLLLLTGSHQLKTHLHGCPEPLLISLHNESTFKSLDYIAQQIYKLSFMSWRSYFPSSLPVTISYSDFIAKFLSELKDVQNWNPDILLTKLRESRWFL